MIGSRLARRRLTDRIVKLLCALAALFGCFMLGWILYQLLVRGGAAMNADFFTKLPPVPGAAGARGGGMINGIIGTLAMTAMASIIGIPLGLLAGVYVAEFGRGTRLAATVRFAANLLMGVPSIIVGVFVYAILVAPLGHFSGWAGAVALAIMMIPIVTRTTEDMLIMVPGSLRESALALGATRWRVTFQVLFRAAKVGILTGVILSVARIAGETAPLLFTAMNSDWMPTWTLGGPTPNLTVQIWRFAMSPYDNWQQLAWGAAFLITVGVLLATISCRVILRVATR